MRMIVPAAALVLFAFPSVSVAGKDYRFTGHAGVMHFVAVTPAAKNNEDTYRLAVAEACAGKPICQVQFWVSSAPKTLPMTDAQVASKFVHWQQNLNTGLRRWLVNCKKGGELFKSERACM
jgi:hypothetical protein